MGLSQEQLAFRCSLDRSFISLLERGRRQPSLQTLLTLAEGLELAPDQLLKRVTERMFSSGSGVPATERKAVD